jgi:hypothetical protein
MITVMSLLTLEYPADSLPGLPSQDGQRFEGFVMGGKLHVTVRSGQECGDSAEEKRRGVERFVQKWSGQGTLLPPDEVGEDPRLAYLTAKYLE